MQFFGLFTFTFLEQLGVFYLKNNDIWGGGKSISNGERLIDFVQRCSRPKDRDVLLSESLEAIRHFYFVCLFSAWP